MTTRGYSVRKGYESIPRDLLQPADQAMSARALGILVHLLSRPDGWRSSAQRLAKTFCEGRAAIETALGELEELGYLARQKVRVEGGRIGWIWMYGDDPAYVAGNLATRLAEVSTVGSRGASITHFPGPGEPSLDEPATDFRVS